MAGYIYILSNAHMPDLVKIGFTDRDPQKRAAELSAHTGVPGKFKLVHSWLIIDAANAEKRVHTALYSCRATGEFFRLSPGTAKNRVTKILQEFGLIGSDGLSFEARVIAEQEREIKEKTQQWLDEKRNLEAFIDAMSAIRRELARRENTTPISKSILPEEGFLCLIGLKNGDPPSKLQARLDFYKSIRLSYAEEIKATWLFKAPDKPFLLAEDVRFQTINRSGGLHQGYRIPAGTRIESSKGWAFGKYSMFNYSHPTSGNINRYSTGELKCIATGEIIKDAYVFTKVRHLHCFEENDSLGVYLMRSARIFIGQLPLYKI